MSPTDMPAPLRALDETHIIDLDVREDLRSGREPFARIMDARTTLPPDGVLRLRAIFEPHPLYAVMEKHGLSHWTERLSEDDWRVWFYPGHEASQASSTLVPTSLSPVDEPMPDGAVVLDVRGLEPPEPMVRTLEALEHLERGTVLVQINERIPRFLLPILEERGLKYQLRQQGPDLVRVFIEHG